MAKISKAWFCISMMAMVVCDFIVIHNLLTSMFLTETDRISTSLSDFILVSTFIYTAFFSGFPFINLKEGILKRKINDHFKNRADYENSGVCKMYQSFKKFVIGVAAAYAFVYLAYFVGSLIFNESSAIANSRIVTSVVLGVLPLLSMLAACRVVYLEESEKIIIIEEEPN